MPRRIPPYLKRARQSWTDMTAFAVFIAWVVGLSLLADAATPLAFRNPSLTHLSRLAELEYAGVCWLFVAFAFIWPIFGGMASGVLLCLLFGVSALMQRNWFGIVFWLALGIVVIVGTHHGIRDGTLRVDGGRNKT